MRRGERLFAEARALPSAAPAWVVTYADMVTLLLCLFVAVLSMSSIRKDRFDTVLGSIQSKFGDPGGSDINPVSMQGTLEQRLREIVTPASTGEGGFESDLDHCGVALSRTQHGLRVIIGGPEVFERGSDQLLPGAVQLLGKVASELGSRSGTLIIKGHSAAESAAVDGKDLRDLSYGRAAAIARLLEDHGAAPENVTVIAVGAGEPLVGHAYTHNRRALNRRVEIEIVDQDGALSN